MTTLETRFAKLRLQWVWNDDAYMTIHNNFGLIIYHKNEKIWLCVLSPKTTKDLLETHNTTSPYLTGFWNYYNGHRTERMFELPVSNEFLTHVIGTAHPEMFKITNAKIN